MFRKTYPARPRSALMGRAPDRPRTAQHSQQPSSTLKPGIRVVRGPQWSHGDDDGGHGFLGTVTGIPDEGPNYGRVTVVWDSTGDEKTYFAGQEGTPLELRIYDIAPTRVRHRNVTCDACKLEGITGIRWKCAVCTDYDLCSPCYRGDRHDTSHAFMRYVTDGCKAVRVPPRSSSVKKEVYGLVKGAEVVRGRHWAFANQDGGPGNRGKIKEVGAYRGGYYCGGAIVIWDSNPAKQHGYRVGAEGKVELTAVSKTSGGNYYPEHLPLLDVVNPFQVHLKCGDKVKVDVDIDTFRKLQKEHECGWNDGMKQCMAETGTVVGIPHPNVMRVQYEDARIWSVLKAVLTRLGTFRKGDKVKIVDDYDKAVELQVGHGGWNEKMKCILGKIGTIVDIDSDGDLLLEVNGSKWFVSPVSCTALYEPDSQPMRLAREQSFDEDTGPGIGGISFAKMLRDILGEKTDGEDVFSLFRKGPDVDTLREFMWAADNGDLEKVKDFLGSNKSMINRPVKGKTALHIASFRGHLDIVQYLLAHGADKNAADDDGDTPMHFAVHGQQDRVLEILCKKRANMNATNNAGMTPLVPAVDKNYIECVRVLVDQGADVNVQGSDGATPMHKAIRLERKEIIEILLQCEKLDARKTDGENLNVMHRAIIADQRHVVEDLLEKRDILATVVGGVQNWSPLHLAAMNGRTAIAGALIEKGAANLNAEDKSKRTPLHFAVQSCEQTIIGLLLGRAAKVNVQDVDGNTPAHLVQMEKLSTAAMKKKETKENEEEEVLVQTILCMLAEQGADLTIKNSKGKTPLDLCKSSPELVKKLKEIAAKVTDRTGKDDIPPHWKPMGDKQLLIAEMDPSKALDAEEYKNVRDLFMKTMSNVEIISIKRVQNRDLWAVYTATKKAFETRYGLGCAHEMNLFHGTPFNTVKAISRQNINPLLAGSNVGAIWGKGAYFATYAKKSDEYTKPDEHGSRYMFMARVLVGIYGQGKEGLQIPPPASKDDDTILCDAVVDDIDQPRIFVIFSHAQIYPEFLIQYSSGTTYGGGRGQGYLNCP